jgi:hypothetical protein
MLILTQFCLCFPVLVAFIVIVVRGLLVILYFWVFRIGDNAVAHLICCFFAIACGNCLHGGLIYS